MLCILLLAIVIMSDSAENTGSEQLTIRVKDQVRSDCTNSGFNSFDLLPGAGRYRVWTSKVATASIWAVFLPSSCYKRKPLIFLFQSTNILVDPCVER